MESLFPGPINYFPVWAGRFDKSLEDFQRKAGSVQRSAAPGASAGFRILAGITDLERVTVEDGR